MALGGVVAAALVIVVVVFFRSTGDSCNGDLFNTSSSVRVRVSEECIRSHYGRNFTIPDLAERYERTGFEIYEKHTIGFDVFYEPTSAEEPLLRIAINLRSDASAAGLRRVQLPDGNTLWITDRGDAALGNALINDVAYAFALGTGGQNDAASDALLVWLAQQVIEQEKARVEESAPSE